MLKNVCRKFPFEFVLLVFFTLFYTLTRVRVHGFVHDAQGFFGAINETVTFNPALFHAHHVLPLPLVWIGVRLGSSLFHFSHQALTIPVFQLLNSICMAAAMAGVYAILKRRFEIPFVSALWGTLLTSLTFGCWAYSSALEIYAPAMALMMWVIYALLAPQFTLKSSVGMALLLVVGFFCHSMLCLLGIWGLFRVWTLYKQHKAPKSAVYAFPILSMGIGFFGYCAVFWTQGFRTIGEALKWLSPRAGFRYDIFELAAIGRIVLGFGKALFGGFFIFSSSQVGVVLSKLAPLHQLSDEAFVSRFFPEWGVIPLISIALGLGAFMALACYLAWKNRTDIPDEKRTYFKLILGVVTLYFLQGVIAEMTNADHYLFVIPGLGVLLTVVAYYAFRSKTSFYLGVAVVGLFVLVYTGSIFWLGNPKNDYFALKTKALIEEAGAQGFIVVETDWQYQMYLYPHPRVLFLTRFRTKNPDGWVTEVQQLLQEAQGPIVISQTAFSLTAYNEKRFGLKQAEIDQLWPVRALSLHPHPEFEEAIFVLEFSDMFFKDNLLK